MTQKINKKIAIRLDDFHENCDLKKWEYLVEELIKRKIPVHIGLIPRNRDQNIISKTFNFNHWEKALNWQSQGVHFWIHGFEHRLEKGSCYFSLSKKGEFFNDEIETIRQKISKSISLFNLNKIDITGFIAPAHGYSEKLLKVLEQNKSINVIWDGYWPAPKKHKNINLLPQQYWDIYPLFLLPEFSGICLHPSAMSFRKINYLLKKIDQLNISYFQFNLKNVKFKKLNFFDQIFNLFYRIIKFIKH